jgi:hypothetical protein
MPRTKLLSLLSSSLREAGWAPALVFLLHGVASLGFAAYELCPPLDIPAHFFGGVAISFFIGRTYRIAERLDLIGQPGRWLYFVTVPALAVSVTVFWEFAEYLTDRSLGTHTQLGLEDTLLDLFLGFLGSLAFLAFAGKSTAVSKKPVPKDADATLS